MSEEASLESRINELEAIRSISNLESDYGFASDTGNVSMLLDLFTDDGVIVLPTGEKIVGKEAIRKFREDAPKRVAFSVHYLLNPHIVVDGDRAQARYYWLAALEWVNPKKAVWSSGYYQDEFVRTEKGWKFRQKKMNSFFRTSYNKGWVEERMMGVRTPCTPAKRRG